MTTLVVATVNILIDSSRWTERRTLLSRGLAALAPDLIACQEVANPLGESPAHWLAGELGGYSVHVCPQSGRGRRREGIAVLSRLPVASHETLDLGSQRRVAQFVRVATEDGPFVLVNGHYHWPVGVHGAQVRQVQRVLDRVQALDAGTPVIACGDFNARPESPAITLMRRSFTSAYPARHGREPDFTCPTPLISGGRFRRMATRSLLKLLSIQPSDVWRGTLDYLFVTPDIRVVNCDLFLDRPAADDPSLYPSDHFGLAATLEVRRAPQ